MLARKSQGRDRQVLPDIASNLETVSHVFKVSCSYRTKRLQTTRCGLSIGLRFNGRFESSSVVRCDTPPASRRPKPTLAPDLYQAHMRYLTAAQQLSMING